MKHDIRIIIKCFQIILSKPVLFCSWGIRAVKIVLSFILSYSLSQFIRRVLEQSFLINKTVVLLLAIVLFEILLDIMVFYLETKFEKENRVAIKERLLNTILRSDPDIKELRYTSKNTEVLYSDVNSITSILLSGWSFIMDIVSMIISTIIIMRFSDRLMVIILILVLAGSFFGHRFRKQLKSKNLEIRKDTDKNYKYVRNTIMNYQAIIINRKAHYFVKKFSEDATVIKDKVYHRDLDNIKMSVMFRVLGICVIILVIAACVFTRRNQEANVVFLVSCSRIYYGAVTGAVLYLTTINPQLISAQRVFSLLEIKTNRGNKGSLPPLQTIKLKDVSFSYNNEINVIHHLDCTFESRGIYVLQGKNGTGKTTLLHLIGGVLLPKSGRILWNNEDVSGYSYSALAEKIAYYTQNEPLFDISVKDNILLDDAKDNDYDVAESLCKELGIWNDILALPDGLDTSFSEMMNMSYGQRKKVGLIRTLIKKSEIILLDEPFEGLDKPSQEALFRLLKRLSMEKAIILSTHIPIGDKESNRIYL